MKPVIDLGRRIIPIMVPFREDQSIDFEKLSRMVDTETRACYCDAINIGGTASEFVAMSMEERAEVIRCTVETVGGRKPVVAGTGYASTRMTQQLTEKAERAGADVALVIAPYYQKPTQAAILRHYRDVAAATGLPVMIYNNAFYQGVNIQPDTIREIAQLDNVVAIKEGSGNFLQMTSTVNAAPEGFRCYTGDDSKILPMLVQGAHGIYGGMCTFCGERIQGMMDKFYAGDMPGAIADHRALHPLFQCFYMRENPIPLFREAMRLRGADVGCSRAPLTPATPEESRVIAGHMQRLGLI